MNRSNNTPTKSIPSGQILVSNTIVYKKEPGLLQKWLILGLGQGIHKISLEHTVMPEREKAVRKANIGECQRDSGAN